MPATMYEVGLEDGQTFWMTVDLAQAASPIRASWGKAPGDKSRWQTTPFQSADASHNFFSAAQLLANYFKAGPDDCTEVVDVQECYDFENEA